jgi:signal transduction histidine kinase
MMEPMSTSMTNAAALPDAEPDPRRTVLIDGLLAVALAVTTVAPVIFYADLVVVLDEFDPDLAGPTAPGPSVWWVLAVALAIAAPLTVRRLWPRTSFAAVLALTIASTLPPVVDLTDGVSTFLLGMNLPLLVSVFTLANLVDRRSAVVTGLLAAAALIVGSLVPYTSSEYGLPFFWIDLANMVVYVLVPVVLVVAVAQILRDQRLRADAAQHETAMAMVSAELRAASAASAERRRLASELHDIVAHHVNLMVVQAEKGPFVRDAGASSLTFATIAETGRSALGELDRLLGLLRTDGAGALGAPSTAPLPTVEVVPSLIDAANSAGVGVVLQTFDIPSVVDPAVSATVHRIVQECITNVIKHADRTEPATVSVTTEHEAIVVRVSNRSAGEQVSGRRGHGLDSMRSRLDLFGGSLHIDDSDGWFRVEAIIPVEPVVVAPSTVVMA